MRRILLWCGLLTAALACGETDAEDAGRPSPDGAAPSADSGQPDAAPRDAAAADSCWVGFVDVALPLRATGERRGRRSPLSPAPEA